MKFSPVAAILTSTVISYAAADHHGRKTMMDAHMDAHMESYIGTGVGTKESRKIWWDSLEVAEQTQLTSLFESTWFESALDEDGRIAYAYTAQQVYDFLETDQDSNAFDSYIGFAPLLLRASFHGAGTYTKLTGTGGSNGGTIFNQAELDDGQNSCISTATTELFGIFHGSNMVPLADSVVIAGVVALDVMEFPRMDLLSISGGRVTVDNLAHRDRLPSADDDPMERFTKQYDLTLSQAVALAGGAHNFGSAHAKCSGYEGQWTASPLSWYGPNATDPTFFADLLLDDWRWYEVCTYENNTVNYITVEDPFANGMPAEGEHHEGGASGCAIFQNREPILCEEQAMRGCDFSDGSYQAGEFPCDASLLQMRLKSDFFLKANPMMLPFSEGFAQDPNLLAEEFGIAYHKITHNGVTDGRCGLSGHGCTDGHSCQQLSDNPLTATCVYDGESMMAPDDESEDSESMDENTQVESAVFGALDDGIDDNVFVSLLAVVLAFCCITLGVVAIILTKVNSLNHLPLARSSKDQGSQGSQCTGDESHPLKV